MRRVISRPASWLPALLLAAALLLLPRASGALAQIPPGESGTITVEVQYLICDGASAEMTAQTPQAGDSTGGESPSCYRQSAPGVQVIAVPAGDGDAEPAARSMTNGLGATTLPLLPGSYWLFVPEPDEETGTALDDAQPVEMPDGTEVLGWHEVEITPTSHASMNSVTITIQLAGG
jgi:hypothetical protein